MAILKSFDRAAFIPETMADLVQGFAVLTRALGPTLPEEHAVTLQTTVQRLLGRMEAAEWEQSTDLLREAAAVLERRNTPTR